MQHLCSQASAEGEKETDAVPLTGCGPKQKGLQRGCFAMSLSGHLETVLCCEVPR